MKMMKSARFVVSYVSTNVAGLRKVREPEICMADGGVGGFRRFAEECRRLAGQVVAIDDKAILLDMAQVWIRLADRAREVEALLNEDTA
jgi:hypothetical protein